MTLEEFWAVITRVCENAPDSPDGKCETLKSELGKLSLAHLQSFAKFFGECLIRAYTRELWGAAYIVGGGCGDDFVPGLQGNLNHAGKGVL